MIKKKKKKNMIEIQHNDYVVMCKYKEKPFRKKYQQLLNYRVLIPIKERLNISEQYAESLHFRNRLTGAPPDKALMFIKINPN